MKNLNFPTYSFKFKSKDNKRFIFDCIRKKYVSLTPEEWVRQHMIYYLIHEKKYSKAHIAVEKQIKLNKVIKRFDIIVFYPSGKPRILIECKAPEVKITQETFDQIAKYNMEVSAEFLILSNGLKHYICKVDLNNKSYSFLNEIPNK